MHIVAVHTLPEDKERVADPLASALGVTRLEALSIVRKPGPGPFVVALFAEALQAEPLSIRLRESGFSFTVLTPGEIEAESGQNIVKRFEFASNCVNVESSRNV